MKLPAAALLLLVLVIGLNIPLQAYGKAPIRISSCPTYHTNLLVIFIDSAPRAITVGSTVATTFHVVYPDLTPVHLSPQVAEFSWSNSSGFEVTTTSPVTPTNETGFYSYTATVTPEYPTGQVTIAVVVCSCQDGGGNFGPVQSVDSTLTADPSDDSIVSIGPVVVPQVQPQPQFPVAIIALIAIFILLIAALLLMIRRRRKQTGK